MYLDARQQFNKLVRMTTLNLADDPFKMQQRAKNLGLYSHLQLSLYHHLSKTILTAFLRLKVLDWFESVLL